MRLLLFGIVIWFRLVAVAWCFNCVGGFVGGCERLVVWFDCAFDFVVVIVGWLCVVLVFALVV